MSNADTIDLLQQHLDKDPSNQLTRGVLADLLMETDPVAGEAVMWLVEFDKYPDLWSNGHASWWPLSYRPKDGWLPDHDDYDPSDLPDVVHQQLSPDSETDTEPIGRVYATRRQAENTFVEAYRALGERKRRELWVREAVEI